MNLTIRGFREVGLLQKERIVIDVSSDTDIGSYLLVASTFVTKGNVSAEIRRAFWFPDKKVKKDDVVVVYTRSGNPSEKTNDDGSTSHFLYWGLDESIWTVDKAAGVLMLVSDWEAQAVK